MEYYNPVWIIVTDRRVDIEAIWQFSIYSHLITEFQLISEVHLYALRVNHHKVVERLVRFHGVHAQTHLQGRRTEDVAVKLLVELMVSHMLNHGDGLALIDDVACLDDKLQVALKLKESSMPYFL